MVLLFAGMASATAQQPQPDTDPSKPAQPASGSSTAPRPDPARRGLRPLTPQELRDLEIRRYDPRSGSDPVDRQQDTGLVAPPKPGDPSAPGATNGLNQRALPAPRPLPGSVAASNQGPQILDSSQTNAAQDYSGPAVLSRSYTISRPNLPQQIKWSPMVGVNEAWESGVPLPGPLGAAPKTASTYGTVINWGVSGKHLWKREQVTMSYFGNLSNYSGARSFNGSNHTLNLQYSRVLTRHLMFSLAESAESTSQSQSLLSSALPQDSSIANVNLALSPGAQPIDQGMRHFSSSPSLLWKKSSRTTITLGGGIFFVERKDPTQGGTTGHQAQADVTYRLSSKTTVGTYYSYTNYVFTKHISVSGTNTYGGILSYALNRSTQVRMRLGLSQIETTSLSFVRFPIELVPLLGQLGGIAVVYHKSSLQDVSAEFAHDFGRRRAARVSYAKGLAPGNGTILTSSRESLTGNFSMSLFGKYRANAGFNIDRLSSVGTTQEPFTTKAYQFNVTRPHAHNMTSSFGFDMRSFTTPGTGVPQLQIRFTTGISWAPEEGNLWK